MAQVTKKVILVVEDESAIADAIVYPLQSEGFAVNWVQYGQQGIAQHASADLVILDIGLPDLNGFEVCKKIRADSNVPIIFLTARQAEVDRIISFEIGADDYVTKPFSPRELAARVKAILKRVSGNQIVIVRDNRFAVDDDSMEIGFKGVTLELTRYEFRLLRLLLRFPARVFSRRELMQHVWENPDVSLERTVDTHIKRLREKIRAVDPEAAPIKTHHGLGYSLLAG